MLMRPRKDDEDTPIFGTHPGDFGVVIVAAMITLVMVGILVLPSPFAKLERAQAEQARIARQKEIDKAVATGEVSVSISPSRHH